MSVEEFDIARLQRRVDELEYQEAHLWASFESLGFHRSPAFRMGNPPTKTPVLTVTFAGEDGSTIALYDRPASGDQASILSYDVRIDAELGKRSMKATLRPDPMEIMGRTWSWTNDRGNGTVFGEIREGLRCMVKLRCGFTMDGVITKVDEKKGVTVTGEVLVGRETMPKQEKTFNFVTGESKLTGQRGSIPHEVIKADRIRILASVDELRPGPCTLFYEGVDGYARPVTRPINLFVEKYHLTDKGAEIISIVPTEVR